MLKAAKSLNLSKDVCSEVDVPETHYLSSLQDASLINAEPPQLALFIGVAATLHSAFPWHTIKLLNFFLLYFYVLNLEANICYL